MKTLLIKSVLCIFGIALFFSISANAQAVSVPSLEINSLGSYNGKFLTVYYAIGNRAAIATSDDQITMREVKLKKTFQINGNSVVAPRVDLSRSGIFMAYNLVVMVVHSDANYSWKNVNGSTPEGELMSLSSQTLAVDSLTKTELDSIRVGDTEPVRFDFGSKVGSIRRLQ